MCASARDAGLAQRTNRVVKPLTRPLRYAAIGVLNTLVGYALIMLWRAAGMPELTANAAGYALGLCLSFLLNRRWTFMDRSTAPGAAARFAAMAAVAWLCNAGCVWALLRSGTAAPLAHALGMPVYSLVFYLGNLLWVFRRPGGGAKGTS